MAEYKLSYTGEEIEEKLGEVDGLSNKVTELSQEKVDKPKNGNGTVGQALMTNGDGTTYWAFVSSGDGSSSGGYINVFSPSENTVDTAVNNATILSSGAIRVEGHSSDYGYFTTGKLTVEPNVEYTMTKSLWPDTLADVNRARCYSAEDITLPTLTFEDTGDGNVKFVTPSGSAYVRFAISKRLLVSDSATFDECITLFNNTFKLNKYDASSGGGNVNLDIVQTTGNSETAVMSQKAVTDEFSKIIKKQASSINKYEPKTEGWVDAATIFNSGVVTENGKTAYCVTPKIPVNPDTTYTIKPNIFGSLASGNRGRTYDSNDVALTHLEWIDNTDGSVTFTTPGNSSYIRFTLSKATFGSNNPVAEEVIPKFNSAFMLVEGTETPSEFIPYDDEKTVIVETLLEEVLNPYAKKTDVKPLSGKTVVNFGDSIFGNARPPEDISTFLADLTGATVHNCAFGGCRMGVHTGHWDAFSMYRLADSIATGDYSLQDDALNYDDRTSYAEEPMSILRNIDFNKVDIVTIAYGTNDWTGNGSKMDNADNLYDTNYFGGALRYSIERLLGAYPNLKIFILCPTYRFWMDENLEFTEDSDTKIVSSHKLSEYIELSKEIARNYHLPFIDNYYELGINKFNRTRYFNANDGSHHKKEGRILLAEHIAKELF